ncbi:hypothetical protein Q4489_01020 [Thalassotalea sp. 1_MG-2023]|uniref:hypothetical protein n=1 Tax=Thalassotalea sp. 1_MG-2023 TaxID=3062680 RepID=UPI0026E19248|nr:hypothetical protein [Thalassotalea sp. 1_MG-2023]MDO6425571.1 hypothetical protein [Thalassotalea sp. 1_MG-2023]
MKVWRHVFKAPRRVVSIKRRRHTSLLKRQLVMIKLALEQEKKETKEMLFTYKRYTLRQASSDEMKIANKQFLDVLKGLGIGVVAVLPFAPITIPIVIKLGKWLGVDILPSSFNEQHTIISDKKSLDQ